MNENQCLAQYFSYTFASVTMVLMFAGFLSGIAFDGSISLFLKFLARRKRS